MYGPLGVGAAVLGLPVVMGALGDGVLGGGLMAG